MSGKEISGILMTISEYSEFISMQGRPHLLCMRMEVTLHFQVSQWQFNISSHCLNLSTFLNVTGNPFTQSAVLLASLGLYPTLPQGPFYTPPSPFTFPLFLLNKCKFASTTNREFILLSLFLINCLLHARHVLEAKDFQKIKNMFFSLKEITFQWRNRSIKSKTQ